MSQLSNITESINTAIKEGRKLLSAEINPDLLRFHAFVEHFLDVLISLKLYGDPNCFKHPNVLLESMLDTMGYGLKIKVLKESGTISKKTAGELRYINNLRAPSAHPRSKRIKQTLDVVRIGNMIDDLNVALVRSVNPSFVRSAVRLDALEKAIKGAPQTPDKRTAN